MLKGLLLSRTSSGGGTSPVALGGATVSTSTSPIMKVAVIRASNLLAQKHCFTTQPRPPESSYYYLSADQKLATAGLSEPAAAESVPRELRLSYAADSAPHRA